VVWGRDQRRRSKLVTGSWDRMRAGTKRTEEEDLEMAGDRSVPAREVRTQRSPLRSMAGLVRDASKRGNTVAGKSNTVA